jgi:hypothetical protein
MNWHSSAVVLRRTCFGYDCHCAQRTANARHSAISAQSDHYNAQRHRNGMSNANSSAGSSMTDHSDTSAVPPTTSPTSSAKDYWKTKFSARRTSTIQRPIKDPQIGMTLRKSVSFTEVNIREYERILGDNPSCSSGAPIRYDMTQRVTSITMMTLLTSFIFPR